MKQRESKRPDSARPGRPAKWAVRLFAALGAFVCTDAFAGPITFNSALPVSKGELVYRQLFLQRSIFDDTARPDRRVVATGGVSVLGYGVTGKLTLFAKIPYLHKTLDATTPMGPAHRSNHGFGDATLFARYTAYQYNAAGTSFRIAPFLGVVAPTGSDSYRDAHGVQPRVFQPGSGTWGVLGGAVATYQTLNYEIDTSLSYQGNGHHAGFSPGDVTRFDASFQYRLLPRVLGGGLPHFLYGVLETNLIHTGRNTVDGSNDSAPGGTEWFIAPGLQYVTPRWVLDGAIQIPVQRNVPDGGLRDRHIYTVSVRFNF